MTTGSGRMVVRKPAETQQFSRALRLLSYKSDTYRGKNSQLDCFPRRKRRFPPDSRINRAPRRM